MYLSEAGQTKSNLLTARVKVVKGIPGRDSGIKTGDLDPVFVPTCHLHPVPTKLMRGLGPHPQSQDETPYPATSRSPPQQNFYMENMTEARWVTMHMLSRNPTYQLHARACRLFGLSFCVEDIANLCAYVCIQMLHSSVAELNIKQAILNLLPWRTVKLRDIYI